MNTSKLSLLVSGEREYSGPHTAPGVKYKNPGDFQASFHDVEPVTHLEAGFLNIHARLPGNSERRIGVYRFYCVTCYQYFIVYTRTRENSMKKQTEII